MRQRNRLAVRLAALSAVLLTAVCAFPTAALDVEPADCYWYTGQGAIVGIPDTYELAQTAELSAMTDTTFDGLTDAFRADDGRLYLLDSSGKIAVLKADLSLERVLETYQIDGEPVELDTPEGLFVDAAGRIYVADTLNKRIVRMDQNGVVDRLFEEPDNLTGFDGELSYLPSKLAVDSAGRLFVVVRNVVMGIVVLDPEGRFITYRGAPSVTLTLFDAFWRQFSTDEQRKRMTTYVPTEYNNLTINEEDFLFGTISSFADDSLLSAIRSNDRTAKVAPLKKLNLAGEDILRRTGMYAPVGDLVSKAENLSAFTDVALSDCGIYTALDSKKGHLFTYNDDGELLFVFGAIGKKLGQFTKPVAIAYSGDDLLVCDGYTKSVLRFTPTAYGALLLKAVKDYYNGAYDSSYEAWERVLEYNSNLTLAYVGVGKAHYQEKEYKEAMACFKIAGDVEQYSNAYRKVRDGFVRSSFGYIAAGILILALMAIIVGLVRRFRRYCDDE